VNTFCLAFRQKQTHLCPPNKPRRQFEVVELSALRIVVEKSEFKLEEGNLLVERRKGFLSKTVGYPLLSSTDSLKLEPWLRSHASVLNFRFSEDCLSHTITHHQLKIRIYDIKIRNDGATESFLEKLMTDFGGQFALPRWVSKSLTESGLSSSLDRKIWANISLF
jgi:A/G-specific adenine glycosylase